MGFWYRLRHHMLADMNLRVVKNCRQHDLKVAHVHYTHLRWLEWVDNLTWRLGQRRFKHYLREDGSVWVADWQNKHSKLS